MKAYKCFNTKQYNNPVIEPLYNMLDIAAKFQRIILVLETEGQPEQSAPKSCKMMDNQVWNVFLHTPV